MVRHREAHDPAAWPLVADEALGLGSGRNLCRGVGWYCWTLGHAWAGTAQTGSQPVAEYARSLTTWLALQRSANEPFMVLTDSSRITIPDGDAHAVTQAIDTAMQGIAQTMSPHLQRWALVVPRDWSANFWSGVIASYGPRLRLTLFSTRAEAWDHLSAPAEVRAAVDTLDVAMSQDAGTIPAVEAALRAGPTPDLDEVARSLGLSPRGLQRRLAALGESFVAIRARIRLERASRLLAAGTPTKAVAAAIGFKSASHFGAWYRSQTGVTPGEALRSDDRGTPSAPSFDGAERTESD